MNFSKSKARLSKDERSVPVDDGVRHARVRNLKRHRNRISLYSGIARVQPEVKGLDVSRFAERLVMESGDDQVLLVSDAELVDGRRYLEKMGHGLFQDDQQLRNPQHPEISEFLITEGN